jgi:hypothetical protein
MITRPQIGFFALGLLAGCNTAQPETLKEITSTSVARSGGQAASPDGLLTLEFANGALAADTVVTIEIDRHANSFKSPVYILGPSGTALSGALMATLAVPSGGGAYSIARVDRSGPEPLPSTVDTTHRKISADLPGFFSYALITNADADGGTNPEAPDAGIVWQDAGPLFQDSGPLFGPDASVEMDGAVSVCIANHNGPPPVPPGNDGGIAGGSTWTPCQIEEIEPNDTPATAQNTELMMNSGVEINATFDGTPDDFLFSVPSGSFANLIAETYDEHTDCPVTTDIDSTVTLIDAATQSVLAMRTDGFFTCGAVDYEATPGAARLPPGDYIVEVTGTAPLGRKYKLRIWLLDAP